MTDAKEQIKVGDKINVLRGPRGSQRLTTLDVWGVSRMPSTVTGTGSLWAETKHGAFKADGAILIDAEKRLWQTRELTERIARARGETAIEGNMYWFRILTGKDKVVNIPLMARPDLFIVEDDPVVKLAEKHDAVQQQLSAATRDVQQAWTREVVLTNVEDVEVGIERLIAKKILSKMPGPPARDLPITTQTESYFKRHARLFFQHGIRAKEEDGLQIISDGGHPLYVLRPFDAESLEAHQDAELCKTRTVSLNEMLSKWDEVTRLVVADEDMTVLTYREAPRFIMAPHPNGLTSVKRGMSERVACTELVAVIDQSLHEARRVVDSLERARRSYMLLNAKEGAPLAHAAARLLRISLQHVESTVWEVPEVRT